MVDRFLAVVDRFKTAKDGRCTACTAAYRFAGGRATVAEWFGLDLRRRAAARMCWSRWMSPSSRQGLFQRRAGQDGVIDADPSAPLLFRAA
jgi:hypothetical protein